MFIKICASIRPLRDFYDSVSYARFASGMSLMLNSGMGIYQSLDMVSQLITDSDMKEKINRCKHYISEGDSFAEALLKEHFFNNLYSRMIAIGVKTGNLDSILEKIARIYEEDTVISLSLIVGLILLSVILPLLSIMTSIG